MNQASAAGTIVVVGLGPGDPGLLTREAGDWLASGRSVYLRTRLHPTVAALPSAAGWPSFDQLYEGATGFAVLYAAIVEALLAAATAACEPVVYAVPGHPLLGESTVARLRAAAQAGRVTLRIVPGVSFVDVAVTALDVDPLGDNLQLVDGLGLAAAGEAEPFGGGLLPLSPLRPALIGQVYNAATASAVKLALMRLYPDEHPVTIVRGQAGGTVTTAALALYELDHQPPDHLTSVYVPALPPERAVRVAQGLQAIAARLRGPTGCPWDREQTPRSIRANFLEETYEALDALDTGDMDAFREELGDVLLQVYLQAQMAEEAGEFVLEDVYEAIASKLVRRHPHVFGDVVADDSGAVLRNWEEIKAAERRAKGERAATETPSALAGVPRSLPSLARAQLTQERADRLLTQRQSTSSTSSAMAACATALDRARNQLRASATDGADADPAARRAALGDALFALVGLARTRGLDAEEALSAAIASFTARFTALETALRATGRDWRSLTPAEAATLWAAST